MAIGAKPRFAIAALAVSHGLILFAGFIAPYDFASQDRQLSFAPPTRIHFIDAERKAAPSSVCVSMESDWGN